MAMGNSPAIAAQFQEACDRLVALNEADNWYPFAPEKVALRRKIAELFRYFRYEPPLGGHDNNYCFYCGQLQREHDCQFSREVAKRIEARSI